jgi:5-methylcytosine-specific restriction endonuclease McrA
MSKIPTSKKKNKIIALLLRDGCSCPYCGVKFETIEDITLDHVVPKSLGGSNSNKNLLLSCQECNGKKGNMLLTQFIRGYDIVVNRILASFL